MSDQSKFIEPYSPEYLAALDGDIQKLAVMRADYARRVETYRCHLAMIDARIERYRREQIRELTDALRGEKP